MSRVYLSLVNDEWKEVEHSDFWIDRYLLKKLRNIEMIQGKGWDAVIIIDGKERSGKSKLGMTIAWYLSKGKMDVNNFAKGLKEAAKKISILPDGSKMIMDEGSTIFSSKESRTYAQKRLIELFDVVGQKNMVFIICLPCFFDLNKTIAVRRSLFLLHVYPDKKYDRGQYAFWGERNKKNLYIVGKKNFDSYSRPRAEIIGEFSNFEPPFYQKYLIEVKKETLEKVLDGAMHDKRDKYLGKTTEQIVIETEALICARLIKFGLTEEQQAEVIGKSHGTAHERKVLGLNLIKNSVEMAPLSPVSQ